MRKYYTLLLPIILLTIALSSFKVAKDNYFQSRKLLSLECYSKEYQKSAQSNVITINVGKATINQKTVAFFDDERLPNKKGVALKEGIKEAINGERNQPDLVFDVDMIPPGRYIMSTYAVTDSEGENLMNKAKTKFESLFVKIQINEERPTKRVVYVPWNRPKQETGKFNLSGGKQQVKLWLPRGVRLDYIQFKPYIPPAVPLKALEYTPKILPPTNHPRLWVNQQNLPIVKSRLNQGENKVAWAEVKKMAYDSYDTKHDPTTERQYSSELESVAESKAFYYLMTGDRKKGREAVRLMADYIANVEFGNILDITREMGRAIFVASEVYDWCYDLLTVEEKAIFTNNLMRLADDMEIGWPPFLQSIVNGHGNEAQVARDLLAMSIAIYNENPLPYQYTSYAILEELIPLRKFEYQSPRHNQGVNYGAYRFNWDMHAAWLFRRMTGQDLFDENIKNVPAYWMYMRVPDGQMLRDGDGFGAGEVGTQYYWKNALTAFLSYTYSRDPIIKAEFQRQGGLLNNPVLFLLLNDPELEAIHELTSLPLTMDFGPILGSMIARTGWNFKKNSSDVVAEIKGGGYHFGNHQHSDAGSIQLYYRGFQFGDLGLYKFYGTPYDMNFNKRSISHSMMLAIDPSEKFLNTESNDGGTRLNQRFPKTQKEVIEDPMFNNGKVLSTSFGPSQQTPSFSYFSADLVGAYTAKISKYTRSLCFLNMEREDIPAVMILTDDIVTADPNFRKYWQINALNIPEETKKSVILYSKHDDLVGKTHIQMLIPAMEDRNVEILSGKDANSSFLFKYDTPLIDQPEASGHRILFSPKNRNSHDRFLTIMQVADGDATPLEVKHYETDVSYVIQVADRVVSMSNTASLIEKSFTIDIATKGEYQVILTGMKSGKWSVKEKKGKEKFNFIVLEDKNTLYFKAHEGEYTICPSSN